MSRPVLVDQDFQGTQTATGLRAPVLGSDAATKDYVDGAIEAIAWKDSVRAASTATVTLSGPGASMDGITLVANDRVLLKNQTTASENGIYIFNGAAVPLTRSADANTFNELENAVVGVEEGTTNALTWWRQSAVNGTIGSTSVTWGSFMSGAPAASESVAGVAELATQSETDAGTDDARIVTPLKLKTSKLFNKTFAANIGDGSATSFNVDHNLGTYDVIVEVCRTTGNRDTVIADVTRTSVNRVVVAFGAAPASGAYRVIIQATQV